MQRDGARTVLEIVVIVAMLGLLAGMIALLSIAAKEQAVEERSAKNGRKIATALVMYHASNGGYPPGGLDTLVDTKYLTTPDILKIDLDTRSKGYAGEIVECTYPGSSTVKYPQSFEGYYSGGLNSVARTVDELSKVDDNPGILALRLHGSPGEVSVSGCNGLTHAYHGNMLRFREDLSVQYAKMTFRTTEVTSYHSYTRFCRLELFTDVKGLCD